MLTTQTPGWTFLTNHAVVLLCIARDPGARVRDVAALVGITERAVHRIVSELVDEGYLVRERVGRRNQYVINRERHLRDPLAQSQAVGELLRTLQAEQPKG